MTLADVFHLGGMVIVSAATAVAIVLALLGVYLLLLTMASRFASRTMPDGRRTTRFAILVPAHNEEALIRRLIGSLQAQDYPSRLFDVFVVADNCTDATARIAAESGVQVLERVDRLQVGKGYALRWLLERVRATAPAYDAYVVFDADSVVHPRFLSVMDASIERGAQVVQGYYSVLNVGESPLTLLRFAALASLHYLRPLAREFLGLSCGLKGNGMCFRADVLHDIGWQWFTLAEDVEFHLALVQTGIRVQFAPAARVDADMPVSFSQAASQNERWELGRLQLARHRVPYLFDLGDPRTRWLWLDAAIEQLIPPMSVPFALGLTCLAVGVVGGSSVTTGLAAIGLSAQLVHLLAGLQMVNAPARVYRALAYAPIYIAWKLALYGRALVSTRTMSWIRTARSDGETVALPDLNGPAVQRDVA
jgi:cellulose synthase/poly-beta-1,6-N-acetylglucosamine synthase-like glycosyltransferase